MKVLKKHKNRSGQTLLELLFVLMQVVFFTGLAWSIYAIFDVSQKQTMLARSQAFIELGNFSDYGQSEHGLDDPSNEASQVAFILGEASQGARVNLDQVTGFKDAIEGELNLDGVQVVGGGQSEYWATYRFPKAITRVSFTVRNQDLFGMMLRQGLTIAHNRSLNLQSGGGGAEGSTGLFSGSLRKADLDAIASQQLRTEIGHVDNVTGIERAIASIVREDPSLANEAADVADSVNAADGLAAGAQSALISLALQAALQVGLEQLGSAFEGTLSGASASAEGATAAAEGAASGSSALASSADALSAGANAAQSGSGLFGIGGSSFFGEGFIEGGLNLHNFGVATSFASQVLNTANLGFALAGKQVEGLQIASTVTGSLGGISSGLSQLQNFSAAGGFAGEGLGSEFFGGLGQVVGGVGSTVSHFDPDAGRAFGIAGAGLGLAQGVSYLNEPGFAGLGDFQKLGAVGGVVSSTGGVVSAVDPGSELGTGLSVAGGGLSFAGSAGSFTESFKAGNFEGKPFQLAATTGGLIAGASNVGANVAQLSGNEELGAAFGYGALVGGGLGLVGAGGMLAQGIGEQVAQWNENSKSDESASEVGAGGEGSSLTAENPTGGKNGSEFTGAQSSVASASPPPDTRTPLQKTNDAFASASQAMQFASAGMGVALAVRGATGARQDIASAPQTGLGSVAQTNQNLQNLDHSVVSTQLPHDKAARYEAYVDTMNQSMNHVSEAIARGEQPDAAIVARGNEAIQKAQRILDAQAGRPAAGTPERQSYDQQQLAANQQRIGAAHREYQDLFQKDGEVMDAVVQSEQYLGGNQIVVANEGNREEIEKRAKENAKKIKEHRLSYYPDDHPYSLRLKRAEWAWENVNFVSPAEALANLEEAVQTYEQSFQKNKAKLVSLINSCSSGDSC